MALAFGVRLGPYEIHSAIGAGGMGEVWKARDTTLGRDVALKILPDLFALDSDRLARFKREAQILASLNHPNIAAIYGFQESDPSPGSGQAAVQALVLELVEGPTLADRIAQGLIPVDEALLIAKQIAEALEAAHEQGIIHRDLKPANIKLRPDGTVKVLDFGLAKAIEPAVSASPSGLSMSPTITSPAATHVGVILGTAAYMSPEQARGRPADKRSDVWAFGCVLFEILTARRLFASDEISDTLALILTKQPDWSALPATLHPAILRLLRRCLEKEHKRRLPDLGVARIEIDEALADPIHQPALASPAVSSQPSQLWLAWAGWIAVAVVASLWAASSRLQTQPEPRLVQFQITAPPDSRLPLGTPALSPDGRMLVYRVTTPSGESVLYLRNLESEDARPLPGTEAANHPIWSPDSRSLAFMNRGKVKRFDLADGSSSELAATPNVWALTWSRQGLVLFRAGEGGLSVVPTSGGPARSVTSGTPMIDDAPEFLSDGKRFLTASRRADSSMRLDLVTLDLSERDTVIEQTSSGAMVARTPQGESYLLYAKGATLVAHRFDESAGRVVGAPESIVQGIGKVGGSLQVATMTASDTGTLAYQRAGNALGDRLVWIDRLGKEVDEMPAAVVGSPSTIAPDGRYVAISKSNQLWSLDLLRQVATQVTFGEGEVNDAVWSPDGRRVAFRRDGGVYEKDSSGSGEERLLVPGRFDAISSWSPDGRYVLVSEGPRMFMVPLDGDGKRLSAGSPSGTSREGVFSPDGKFIAYTSDESGRPEVYVQPVPPAQGKWRISSEGGEAPSWRKDGKELFFRASNRGITAVAVKSGSTFEPGLSQQLFANVSNSGYVASPNGQRFLMFLRVEVGTDSPITVVLNWFRLLSNQ